jgi:hypothetical protein
VIPGKEYGAAGGTLSGNLFSHAETQQIAGMVNNPVKITEGQWGILFIKTVFEVP